MMRKEVKKKVSNKVENDLNSDDAFAKHRQTTHLPSFFKVDWKNDISVLADGCRGYE